MTEAVETPAEVTAPTESAPVETKTDDAQTAPAETPVESDLPEKKVSETVPYERFKEVNDELKELKQQQTATQTVAQTADYAPAVATDNPFDEATTQGVMSLADQRAEAIYENKEAEKWVKLHADDLKDRAVDSLTRDLIRQGLDRDTALAEAKKELDGRTSITRKEALTEGVKEGQELANKKEQMGAVGSSGTIKIDPKDLSSAEYAKALNIPRA